MKHYILAILMTFSALNITTESETDVTKRERIEFITQAIDFNCFNRCLSQGYQYQLCQRLCSF